MKLDRSQFPPLSVQDFWCEYYLTAETKAALDEIAQNVPMEHWPKKLRPKFIDDWMAKKKRNAK